MSAVFPAIINLLQAAANKKISIVNGSVPNAVLGISSGSADNFNCNPSGIKSTILGAYSADFSVIIYGNITIGTNRVLNVPADCNGINCVVIYGPASTLFGYSVGLAGDPLQNGKFAVGIGAPAYTSPGNVYVFPPCQDLGIGAGTVNTASLTYPQMFTISGNPGDRCGVAFTSGVFGPNQKQGIAIACYDSNKIAVMYSVAGMGSVGTYPVSGINGTNGHSILGPSASGFVTLTSIKPKNTNSSTILIGANTGTPEPGRVNVGIIYGFKESASNVAPSYNLSSPPANTLWQANGRNSYLNLGSSFVQITQGGDFNCDGEPDGMGSGQNGVAYIFLGPLNGAAVVNVATGNNTITLIGTPGGRLATTLGSLGKWNGDPICDSFYITDTFVSTTYVGFGNPNFRANTTIDVTKFDGYNGTALVGITGGYNGQSAVGPGNVIGSSEPDLVTCDHTAYGNRGQCYYVPGDSGLIVTQNSTSILDGGNATFTGINATSLSQPQNSVILLLQTLTSNLVFRNNGQVIISGIGSANFTYPEYAQGNITWQHDGLHLDYKLQFGAQTTGGLAILPLASISATLIRTVLPSLTNNKVTALRNTTFPLLLVNFNGSSIYPSQKNSNLQLLFNLSNYQVTRVSNNQTLPSIFTTTLSEIASQNLLGTTSYNPFGQVSIIDDTGFTNGPFSINFSFIDYPEVINSTISGLTALTTYALNNNNFAIFANSLIPFSNIVYNIQDLLGLAVLKNANLSAPLLSFTEQDVRSNTLCVNSTLNIQPLMTYTISIRTTDTQQVLTVGPFTVSFPGFVSRSPIASFEMWNMLEGTYFNLTRTLANGTSNFVDNSGNLVLNFNSTQNLQIINYQTGFTTSFNLSDLDASQAALIGGPGLPSGLVRICDTNNFCSPYQPIPVSPSSFGFAPRLFGVNTKLGQGQTLPFMLNSVNYTNLNTLDSASTTLSNYQLVTSANQYLNFVSADAQSTLLTNFFLGNLSSSYVNMQNGGQPSSCSFVLVDLSRGLSSAPVQGVFTFAYKPTAINNAFVIRQTNSAGNSLTFGTESLSANDTSVPVNSLQVQFTTQAQCLIDSSQNPGSSLVPYSDLVNRYTRVTTDGSSTPCIFNVTFIDTSNNNISTTFAANITYFDQPILRLSSVWNMFEGIPFNLSLPLINGTSNSVKNQGALTVLFQALQNLQPINYLTGSVSSYKMSDISSNSAALIGGPGLPSGSVAVCNPGLCSPYQSLPVSGFGFAPRLFNVNFTLAEGQRQLLSLNSFNFTNLNTGDSLGSTLTNYRATLSAKQFIEFYTTGTSIVLSSFTLSDAQNSLVEALNGGQASTFQMTLTDTSRNVPFGLSSSSLVVQPRFGYKPVVVNNNVIEVNQTSSASAPAYFGTEALSASSLSSPLSSLNVLFSQQAACVVDSSRNPGSALVSYGDLQSRSTRATVTDPSSPTPCQFNVSFIDPNFNNVTFGPFAARVTFRDIPVVLTTRIDCIQGTDLTLQASNFNARDNTNNASNIFVNWLSLSNAALSMIVNNGSLPVNSYSLSSQALGKIRFKPNAGAAAPSAIIQFVGSSRLPTAPIIISQAANTLTFTVVYPAPVISLNQIITVRGTPVSLSSQLIGVTINDLTVLLSDIMLYIRTVRNAWVQRANQPFTPSNAISQYAYGESLGVSNIVLVPDGTKNTPVLCVEAVTPAPGVITNIGGPQCSPSYLIVPTVPPNILKNKIEIERDEELLITDEMLSGVSGFAQDSNPGDLDWEMNCQNAVLKTNSTGMVIPVENNKFKSLNITSGNIRLKASDTNNAVSCTARAINSDSTATAAETTLVKFNEKYKAGMITANTFPLQLGVSSYSILSSYLAAQDDQGNVGGKLFPLTQPSQMTFNISGMHGASLPPAYDASRYALIPASVLYTLSLTNLGPNAGFNVSACNLAGICTPPIAANFQLTAAAASDTSNALSTNTIVGIVLAPIGFIGTALSYYCYMKRKNDAFEKKQKLQKGTKSVIHLDLCNRFSSAFNITLRIVRGNFSDNLTAEEYQTGLSKILVRLQSLTVRARDKELNEEERILLSGTIISEIKRLLPASDCCDSISLKFGCKREMNPEFLLVNADKIAEAVKKALPDFEITRSGSVATSDSKRTLPLDHAVNVSDVSLVSPTSSGPLLLSSAATAAAGVTVRPDNKSDEPSPEVSGTTSVSNHSGDELINDRHDRSQSPTIFGVPGRDEKTVELMTFSTAAAGVRGSRSQTPPPLSGATSITSTPPSPPAMDPPPPPPPPL